MSKILVLENYLTEADDEGDAGVIVASLKKAAKNGSKKAQDALNKMNKDSKKIAKEIDSIKAEAPGFDGINKYKRLVTFEAEVDDKTGSTTAYMSYDKNPQETDEYEKEFDSAAAALEFCKKVAASFKKNQKLVTKGWKKL